LVDDRVRVGAERGVGRRRNGSSPFEESDGAGGAESGARATKLTRSQDKYVSMQRTALQPLCGQFFFSRISAQLTSQPQLAPALPRARR
jgi:hypothetical protein